MDFEGIFDQTGISAVIRPVRILPLPCATVQRLQISHTHSSTVGYRPLCPKLVHSAPTISDCSSTFRISTIEIGLIASNGKSVKNRRRTSSSLYLISCTRILLAFIPPRGLNVEDSEVAGIPSAVMRLRIFWRRGDICGGGLARTGEYHVGGVEI